MIMKRKDKFFSRSVWRKKLYLCSIFENRKNEKIVFWYFIFVMLHGM